MPEPPVFVTVSDSVPLPPTCTLPKLRVVGLDPRAPAESPVPLRAIVKFELEASDVMVTVPVKFPTDCGANVTVNVALSEAFSVNGAVIPLILNVVPLTEAFDTLTLVPPVLVSVVVTDRLAPTITLPKLSLPGLSASCPGGGGVDVEVPVPVSVRFVTASDAVLVIESVALKVPAAFGVKSTLIGVLCPAARVTGRVGAVREKYLVEIATLLIVTEAVPEFVAVVLIVLLPPALTLPKFNAAFVMVIAPV